MLQNASYMFFFKKQNKQNDYEKSLTRQESNPIHCVTQPLLRSYVKLIVFNMFVPTYSRWRRKCRRTTKWVSRVGAARKVSPNWSQETMTQMSTTKGYPWVSQESQDYVLRSPNVDRK